MRFTPKSDEQLDQESSARGPFKPGEYDFEVKTAVDDTSKAGNEMISLEIKVYNDLGEVRTVKDWLVSSPGMMYKIKHFTDSVGLHNEYEAGTFDAYDCLNRTGKVKLKVEKGVGTYPDKNTVADYMPATDGKPKTKQSAPAKQMAVMDLDDEIPF